MKYDWLAHHGIDGQKWGVKHGPPYPLDSSVSTGSKLKGSGKKITSKNVMYDPNQITDKERLKKATITGMMAMNNSSDYIDTYDPESSKNFNNDAIWFLYEDQTMLMPAIADLANQGFSDKEIRDFFDRKKVSISKKEKTFANDEDWANWYYTPEVLSVSEFWTDKLKNGDYIDKCVDWVKNKTVTTGDGDYPYWYEKVTNEHPNITNPNPMWKHDEIKEDSK